MTVYTLLVDFTIASLLILAGQLIRAKVPFIQKFFIPSSLLAGFMGLILGKNFLNLLPFSDNMSTYPGVLMIFVFASIGVQGFHFTKKLAGKEIRRVVGYGAFCNAADSLQWFVPVLLTILVFSKLWPQLPYGFGLLLASGFMGGHGTAAAVGASLADLGFADAPDLGMTIATVGILAGVFGGIAYVKWATSKGYTQYIKSFEYLSGDYRTGLVEEKNREEMGKETVSSIALDPLCFHLALLTVPVGLGYLLNEQLYARFGISIPSYAVAFLIALTLYFVLGGRTNTRVYRYVDKKVISRISGTCTDYLVFFGVAGIKVPVVVEYAVPLTVICLLGIALTWVTLAVLGPTFNAKSWFERSIFVYGYATGVFAIGFLLLRIADPQNKSRTLSDVAMTTAFLEPVETFIWAAGPTMLMTGHHWMFVAISGGIFAASLLVNFLIGNNNFGKSLADRGGYDGELDDLTDEEPAAEPALRPFAASALD